MRIAVIDNVDSFVYNLVQYIGALGAKPIVFTKFTSLQEISRSRPDGIVISPGPGRPERAGVSIRVVEELGPSVPILGVCLGHQVIAHVFGGRIVRARRLMHGKTSPIRHDGSELFKGVPNPFEATRYHSLAVERESLPACLSVTAETADDHREIMGIKHRRYPVWGVQFHPESVLTICGKQILKNFLELIS
jgi:anthranilate synthase/aminodeoxychorismate synthase-like glutamine amidotransferase